MDILEDGGALQPYHPYLKVEVDLFALDGYAISEALYEFAGFVICMGGLVLVAASIGLWAWVVSRKRPQDA